MRNESRFFTVFPSVVKAGAVTEITISSIHEKVRMKDGEYRLKVVPKEKRDLPRNAELKILVNKFNELVVTAKNSKISFSYEFKDEQEYRLIILNEDGAKMYDFCVYALGEDLFNTMPYRGDMHMHTTCSDGLGTIAQLTSAYRQIGLDFVCITDHHKYYPSIEAIKMFEGVETGLTILTGEEVHNGDMGHIHIINLGGSKSVNELIEADYENLCEGFKKEAKKIEDLNEVDAFDFVMRKWICDKIRENGGKAVFPHPYWTIRDEFHVETEFARYTLKQGIYDIFEVFGGCSPNENRLQAALWQELRLQGIDMPIVGSTDSHDYIKENDLFGKYCTLVFRKDDEKIPDAIMDNRSVAVDLVNETPYIVGDFRLVKYATFLMENFYPVYETYTQDLGALMRCYAETGDGKEAIKIVNRKAQTFKKQFFNKEK